MGKWVQSVVTFILCCVFGVKRPKMYPKRGMKFQLANNVPTLRSDFQIWKVSYNLLEADTWAFRMLKALCTCACWIYDSTWCCMKIILFSDLVFITLNLERDESFLKDESTIFIGSKQVTGDNEQHPLFAFYYIVISSALSSHMMSLRIFTTI